MYANIRGLKGKRSSLIEHIDNEKPEIFVLTETLLQTNGDVGISGYTFFGRARCGKKGGGVGILIKNELRNIVTPFISERPIEMIWIAIRQMNKTSSYTRKHSRV